MSDLKGFKVSDAVGKKVDRPGAKGSAETTEEAPPSSVGFPRIEAEVEHDGPALSGLRERHAALTDLAKSGSAKQKPAAKKAAAAYERGIGVLEHLLATKASMGPGGGESP